MLFPFHFFLEHFLWSNLCRPTVTIRDTNTDIYHHAYQQIVFTSESLIESKGSCSHESATLNQLPLSISKAMAISRRIQHSWEIHALTVASPRSVLDGGAHFTRNKRP